MTFTVEVDVPVPMRDGVSLATNVWRPDGPGPFPALLVRTPYGKDDAGTYDDPKLPDVFALVEAGYAVVAQDVRGTSRSPGTFVPHIHEGPDGLDTLAWLADQSWCDGAVGMWGGSYMGFAQWEAAPHDAPALRAIAPVRLLVGPWSHADGTYPDRSYGSAGSIKAAGVTEAHLRFFDRWVRGRTDTPDDARVRIFVMGIDQWRDEVDWPLPDTRYTDFFLAGGGRANTAGGDGVLTRDAAPVEAADTFLFDPRRPVPSLGGNVLAATSGAFPGPADQAVVEKREDVLCFTTGVLERPVEVTGQPGHRIRLEVSSGNFPRYDRNTNTGGTITTDGAGDLAVAVNRVHHGPARPSRLVLPLIERPHTTETEELE